MNNMQLAQHDWVKHALSVGESVVEYACPECHEPNFSLIPEKDNYYSTKVCCPHCLVLHYRETSWKKKVRVVTDTEIISADKLRQKVL